MLPEFTADGLLPPGDYPLTLDDLRRSMLVTGPGAAGWNADWRLQLVNNLAIMAGQLWQVGITEIFVDGSFAECKSCPNDIDGYCHCDEDFLASGALESDLNRLDPFQVWTWDAASRRPFKGYAKKQLPMWHQYRVELFPHYGQLCGITDACGHPLQFPAAFPHSRNGQEKGIVKLGK